MKRLGNTSSCVGKRTMIDRVAIIANTIVEPGMSGGNRIFIECGKRWSKKGVAIEVFTSDVGQELCRENGLGKARYVIWSSVTFRRMGTVALYLFGTIKGLVSIIRNPSFNGATIVYSSSDF